MRRRALAIFGGALLGVPAAGRAQDPVPLYPQNYEVLLENDRVRVLDFTLRKGDSEQPHFHPANVAVFLADFKIRFTLPDGSTRMREGRPGQVAWSDAVVHQPVNVGDTDARGILVELKSATQGAAAASSRAAAAADADEPLTAVTLIHGLPGKEEDLKQHLLSLAAPTRAEPGCIRYDLYQSSEAKHEFVRLEVWKSSEALEAHKQTPHLRASFEKRQREGWTTQIMTFRRVPE